MRLSDGEINTKYTISKVNCNNKDMENFLLTLGCYEGETIIILSKLPNSYVVKIKGARYNIDHDLVDTIEI